MMILEDRIKGLPERRLGVPRPEGYKSGSRVSQEAVSTIRRMQMRKEELWLSYLKTIPNG
jgi:hypothetical protein